MGILDKINNKMNENAVGGAAKLIKGKIRSTIKTLIKEKRLIFLSAEEVDYTNREGEKQTLSLDAMAMVLVTAAGDYNLLQVGVSPEDVKNMLIEAWNRKKDNLRINLELNPAFGGIPEDGSEEGE